MTVSTGQQSDHLGSATAVLGTRAVLGAPEEDHGGATDAGSAYVFERSGTNWIQTAALSANPPGLNQWFGASIALDDDTIVIGAPYALCCVGYPAGSVHVFTRSGSAWVEQAVLQASDGTGENKFGTELGLSGDTLVVGAPFDDGASSREGAVYVFERSGTVWTERAKLTASDAAQSDQLGASVAIDGSTVVAGAPNADLQGLFEGAAYAFVGSGSSWSEEAKLTALDPDDYDHFGEAVSVSQDTVVVGASWEDQGSNVNLNHGAAYVSQRSGTTWTEQAKLASRNPIVQGHFGWDVEVVGDTLAVSAHEDSIGSRGHVALFSRSGTTWTEDALLKVNDPAGGGGRSVALDGSTVLCGHPFYSTSFLSAGAAFAFRVASGAPVGTGYCTAGTTSGGCAALLSAYGTPSASAASGFHLVGEAVDAPTSATAFFGANGRKSATWGNGTSYLCVVAPAKRAGLRTIAGTGCDGVFLQDLHERWTERPQQNPGAGATVQAQLWYRDAGNTSSKTSSLSDAIEFVVGP